MKKLTGLSALLLVAVSFCVWWWASRPVESHTSSTTTQVAAVVSKAPYDFESPYFKTRLAGDLVVRSNQEGDTAQLLQQIVAMNESNDQMAITLGLLNGGSLNDLSIVKFRDAKPEIYTRVSIAGMPTDAIVFRSQVPQYELAVFWPKDTLYAAIVSSGQVARQQELDTQMMTTVSSWQW